MSEYNNTHSFVDRLDIEDDNVSAASSTEYIPVPITTQGSDAETRTKQSRAFVGLKGADTWKDSQKFLSQGQNSDLCRRASDNSPNRKIRGRGRRQQNHRHDYFHALPTWKTQLVAVRAGEDGRRISETDRHQVIPEVGRENHQEGTENYWGAQLWKGRRRCADRDTAL